VRRYLVAWQPKQRVQVCELQIDLLAEQAWHSRQPLCLVVLRLQLSSGERIGGIRLDGIAVQPEAAVEPLGRRLPSL